jgi:hypothetical protein
MKELWKEVDRGIAKYGEMGEEEIQAEITALKGESHRKGFLGSVLAAILPDSAL